MHSRNCAYFMHIWNFNIIYVPKEFYIIIYAPEELYIIYAPKELCIIYSPRKLFIVYAPKELRMKCITCYWMAGCKSDQQTDHTAKPQEESWLDCFPHACMVQRFRHGLAINRKETRRNSVRKQVQKSTSYFRFRLTFAENTATVLEQKQYPSPWHCQKIRIIVQSDLIIETENRVIEVFI